MALVLRYVDKNSEVAERFVGLVHVSDTLACSLKEAIYSLLSEHSLSPSQICGQGYDGATIAKKHLDVKVFFCHVTNVLNVIGRSFKRRDLLRLLQDEKLEQLLESGEVHTGRGLNQARGLQRPGDTHWRSHFKILDNFIIIFSSIVRVFEVIKYEVLAMSNELNKILQKRDQDIVNAMEFLNITKKRLQEMR
ncbi:uncharacterized protein LOC107762707 [Nicotiana tabacum]|uniref:Uncharacterized protein LOC107762707 n=1 Tax=Nicotiana tabacum TaxID=4097 RepID=A0AC58SJ37_TOBAC